MSNRKTNIVGEIKEKGIKEALYPLKGNTHFETFLEELNKYCEYKGNVFNSSNQYMTAHKLGRQSVANLINQYLDELDAESK